MRWTVLFHDAFEPEFHELAEDVQDEILAHAKMLEQFGPLLDRPRVDTLNGSRHSNMKELRVDAADGVWRVAFAFDPKRRAVLLVAGDKTGGREKRSYTPLIRKADERFDDHVSRLKQERKEVMATTLGQKMDAVSVDRRKKIEARAAELIAEELSLRDLRHAHRLTQERVGEFLGIGQEGVSRLEQRSDLLISTLRSYVEAMGGHLRLLAEFPDRPAVVLSGLAAMEGGLSPRPSRSQSARSKNLRAGRRNRPRR